MADNKSPLIDKNKSLIIYAGVVRQPKKTNLAEYTGFAEVGLGKEVPFKFLVQLEEQFAQMFSPESVQAARERGMQEAFEDKIKQLVESYNAPPASESRTKKMMDKVEAVNENLQEAMTQVLEREERINEMAESTERLAASSLTLQNEATALHRSVWWRNTKMIIIGVVVAALLVLLIVWDLFG